MARSKRPVTMTPKVFNVYKPKGMTSADVVFHFKKNLPEGFGKIGHLGTLDPFAEGVLLIAIAGAARVSDYLHKLAPKSYRAKGLIGVQTDTGDLEGSVVKEGPPGAKWLQSSSSEIQQCLKEKFEGGYDQAIPAFSAAKHKGRPLYEYARRGERIEKEKVHREIYELSIEQKTDFELLFHVSVGSGAYIRTLFEDFCDEFDTLGHLIELKRTQVGHIKVCDSLKREDWPVRGEAFDVDQIGLDLNQALVLPELQLSTLESQRYRHGQTIFISDERLKTENNRFCWVFDDMGILCGLGQLEKEGLRPSFNLPKVLA